MRHRIASLVLFILAASVAGSVGAAEPESVPEVTYKESPAGLRRLFQDAIRYVEAGNSEMLQRLSESLVMPNASSWFGETFGPHGEAMAERYEKQRFAIPLQMTQFFEQIVRDKQTSVRAVRLDRPCTLEVRADQYPVLAASVGPVHLYEVHTLPSSPTATRCKEL